MEKRTLLAVVLSMVVMLVFLMVQDSFFPRTPPPERQPQEFQEQAHEQARDIPQGDVTPILPPSPLLPPLALAEPGVPVGEIVLQQYVTVETDLLRVVLTNAGGNIVSFQLRPRRDRGELEEMILTGDVPAQAFAVAFGNLDDVMAGRVLPDGRNFRVRQISRYVVEFAQEFSTPGGGEFTMTKRYQFQPGEYMFQLTVSLDGGPSMHYFNFNGAAYTLIFGPQIGPTFQRLDGRHEYRNFSVLNDRGRLRNERVTERDPSIITNHPRWAAIVGKYFTLAAMPLTPQYHIGFSVRSESGLSDAARMFVSRPALVGSQHVDSYLFYFGPKTHQSLIVYERGDNAFAQRDTNLIELAANRGFLSPLENILKWFLELFHSWVPNYGVAIIFLTILVRLLMFPLTKKGMEASIRMQALSPKIKEIQERNKGNPQKMNAEMGEFYKREGYNPLSGCFPMLIQLPIFIAMFNLFSNHFDLRGAMFIPGWIPDLSVPEYILYFPNGYTVPFLGWTALRLLPFIYVGSQLLYGKVVQTPEQKHNKHMKMMLYVLPLVFFFILYEMPSGLLLYWTMSNLLTMAQQFGLNKYTARKKAAAAALAPPEPAKPILPPGGAKKKKKK